jgi:RNA polymerase sigma factor (sigma-70 family)
MAENNAAKSDEKRYDDGLRHSVWVNLNEIMFGTGLPLDLIEERIESCGVVSRDDGHKFLYCVDDSFMSAFPDYNNEAAKTRSFKDFKARSHQYVPEDEAAGKGVDELDFSGESEKSDNNDYGAKWQRDTEQEMLDMLKADIPDRFLTREEGQKLADDMKADMGIIVKALYSDMKGAVSRYLQAISPEGEGSYFRSLLPENNEYVPDEEEEMVGSAVKGSARDVYMHHSYEIKKNLGDRGLEALLKGKDSPIKVFANTDPNPEYVRYVYNGINAARKKIKVMSNRKRSEAARNIGFKDYKDMEKKMSTLDNFMESYTQRRNVFITHNIRWVMSVAKRYRNRGLEYIDLVQEGIFGLERAAVNYRSDRGTKFSTYGTWWIKQRMHRAIDDLGRTIKVPVHMWPYIHKTRDLIDNFNEEKGRNPTPEEIHNILNKQEKKSGKKIKRNITMKNVQTILTFINPEARLDAPIMGDSEDGDMSIGDMVECDSLPCPDQSLEEEDQQKYLREAMRSLTPREEKIIKMRFGIGCDREQTLEEVGYDFNVTRERIRQLEARALRKLPEHLKDVLGYSGIRKLRKDVKQGIVL